MFSAIKNNFSAVGLQKAHRADSAALSTQLERAVFAQQSAAARQSGGATLDKTANEQPAPSGKLFPQSRPQRAGTGNRFRAFFKMPLFNKKSAPAPAEAIALQDAPRHEQAPRLTLNIPKDEGLEKALDRVWKAHNPETSKKKVRFADPESVDKISDGRPRNPSIQLKLNANRHVALVSAPEARDELLAQTIGRDKQRYQSVVSSADNQQHVLLEDSGRLLAVHSSADALAGVASSKINDKWERKAEPGTRFGRGPKEIVTDHTLTLSKDGTEVSISKNNAPSARVPSTVALPDAAVMSQLTGIYRQHDGQCAWRVFDRKLYQMPEGSAEWKLFTPSGLEAEKRAAQLSRQADNQLYCVHGKVRLCNLDTGAYSEKLDDRIYKIAVNDQGKALLLVKNEKTHHQSLKMLARLDIPKSEHQTVKVLPESTLFAAVAWGKKHVFAVDSDGKLLVASHPDATNTLRFGAGEALDIQQRLMQQIKKVVGERFHLEDLVLSDNNQLHAIVKDGMDRKHAIALHPENPEKVSSAWNLNDSLVMDYQKGLVQPKPEPHEIVSLWRNGLLTLHDGRVHYYNEMTQVWEATEIEAKGLRAGQDGQAWITTDKNDIKRLKINFSSNKLNAEQNAFALSLVKKSVTEDLALAGAKRDVDLAAITVLDNGRFAELEKNGDMHIFHVHAESRSARQAPVRLSNETLCQAMRAAESAAGIESDEAEHKVKDIAVGPDNRLFMLSEKGRVFSLPQQAWLKGKLDSMITEPLPEVKDDKGVKSPASPEKFFVNQRERIALKSGDEMLVYEEEGRWKQIAAKDVLRLDRMPRHADKYFARISKATPEGRLFNTGLTYKREINTFGQTGHDGPKVHTPFRTRLNAFVFRPVAQMRPAKNAYALASHSYAGRKGLKEIYQEQGRQFAALGKLLDNPARRLAGRPLDQLLEAVSQENEAPDWLSEVGNFATLLSDSASRQASLLKERYGQDEGAVKKKLTAMTGQMNPASQRDARLIDKLQLLFQDYPPDARNHARAALGVLDRKAVELSHQKEVVPMGMRRDRHDEMGLTKSRLILDGLTLAKLHDLTLRVKEALRMPAQERTAELDRLHQEFMQIRESDWENNPINHVTQQGFTDNNGLEANYDAMKTMVRAFSEPEHAMNVTARTVLHMKDQDTMITRLYDTVLSMKKDESIAFTRAYGVNMTLAGVPSVPGSTVISGLGARGGLDRNYTMTLTRVEGGVNVSFSRDGSGSVTLIGGAGYNVLTDHMKQHPVHLGEDRELGVALRFGVGLTATPLDLKKQNNVTFEITEAEFPQFVKGLSDGILEPLELLKMVINHSVKHGNVMNVSLDANALAVGTANFPLTTKSEKESPVTIGVGGGGTLTANLATATRERSVTRKEFGSSHDRSNNHLQVFNKASVGFNVPVLNAGVTVQDKLGKMPFYTGAGASFQWNVDSTTKHSLAVGTKVPRELADTDLDNLTLTLSRYFYDPPTTRLLDEIGDPFEGDDKVKLTPQQKLTRLDQHFTPRNADSRNNAQRNVLRDLDKLILQHNAWKSGHLLLDSAEHKITLTNMSKVTGNSIKDMMHALLADVVGASDLAPLIKMAERDPELQSLLDELKKNTSTNAVITFELKDDKREELEKRLLSGNNVPQDLHSEILSPGQMRIKSVDFTRSQVKNDGFATPAFLLGGSNSASVTMKRSMGKINFRYGKDQDVPTTYTLDGRIAKANDRLIDALSHGQERHFVLK